MRAAVASRPYLASITFFYLLLLASCVSSGILHLELTFKWAGVIIRMLHSKHHFAPVVKGISRRPPEPEVGVRIPAGAPYTKKTIPGRFKCRELFLTKLVLN